MDVTSNKHDRVVLHASSCKNNEISNRLAGMSQFLIYR